MEADKSVIRVLLADDHAVVRAGIRQILESVDDIRVIAEASDGFEASRLVAQHEPAVALLDIQMPGMTGIETAHNLHQSYPALKIVILTAYDDEPYLRASLRAGANGFILKTAEPAEIVRAVRQVHQGGAYLDPTITQTIVERLGGRQDSDLIEALTERELKILQLAGRGLTNKAIAARLKISPRTVQNHLANIFRKLQASSRTEAVMRAVTAGWLPPTLGAIDDEKA